MAIRGLMEKLEYATVVSWHTANVNKTALIRSFDRLNKIYANELWKSALQSTHLQLVAEFPLAVGTRKHFKQKKIYFT